MIGMGTGGTITGFLTGSFNGTGKPGIIIDIGKGMEPGAFRAINLDGNNIYKRQDIKDTCSFSNGLSFREIINGCMDNRGNFHNSIINPGVSMARGNHGTKSLMENLKAGMENMEGKRTRSLKTFHFFGAKHTVFISQITGPLK